MAETYSAYQYSSFWGTTKNKIWPAIKDGRGRDLFTHYFKMYPSDFTKWGHEKMFGKKKKRGGKKNPNPYERALAALDREFT